MTNLVLTAESIMYGIYQVYWDAALVSFSFT